MLIKVQHIDVRGYKEVMIALCDKDLVGRTFKEKERELWVNPRFYKGHEVSESIAASVLRSATIANLVGKRAVETGLRSGIIDKENVIEVQGIPHAQMVRMRE